MSYDLVIIGGRLFDGAGSPGTMADVAVKDGKIDHIGRLRDTGDAHVIDASGLCVSPGWIDVHMHADHTVLGNTRCESYIHQGVTTVTMGNCGLSMYPLHDEHREDLIQYLKPFTSGLDLEWNWRTLADFLGLIEAQGVGINLVPFVGHGSIRVNVMGFQNRDASPDELVAMKRLLREAMDEGAHGMSTGLGYPPGVFTKDDELVELCGTLREKDGLYSTHMRGNIENLEDTIDLGLKAKVPIQVSHLGSSCASHKQLSGRHEETTLKALDDARAQGLDVTADIYPYTAGSSLLSQVIPDWAHEGGVDKMLRRLNDPEIRRRLEKEYSEAGDRKGRDFTKVLVTFVKSEANKRYEGMTVAEVATARGVPVVDALCDLLIEENAEAMNVSFWGVEEDVDTLVQHPSVMPCSDGWSHAPYGRLGEGKPHPRCYGAFPRYLRLYARERRFFTYEEAIRRMTSMPAQRLGLQDRGLLRVGMAADMVVFDPATVTDRATFSDPHRYPEGIPYVVVNGEAAISDGEHTGVLAGRVLRRRCEP